MAAAASVVAAESWRPATGSCWALVVVVGWAAVEQSAEERSVVKRSVVERSVVEQRWMRRMGPREAGAG